MEAPDRWCPDRAILCCGKVVVGTFAYQVFRYIRPFFGTVTGRPPRVCRLTSTTFQPSYDHHGGLKNSMLTLFFCLDGTKSVMRFWPAVPRIGETIALPELGGNLNP